MYGWSGHARTPHGNTQNRFKDFCLEAKALTVLCVPIRPTAIAAAKIFQVQEFLLLTIDMLTGACTAGRGTLERRRSALGPGRAPGGLLHLLCFIERGWQRGAHRHTRGWEIAGCLIPYTHPTPYTLHLTPYTLHPAPYTLHPCPQAGVPRVGRHVPTLFRLKHGDEAVQGYLADKKQCPPRTLQ
jgi:hypothetical protein